MKTKLMAMAVLAVGSMFAQPMFAQPRVSVGIGFGGGYAPGYYAPAAPYEAQYAAPPCPGPGYVWVDGYWNTYGPRRSWVAGFWRAPAYPRYEYRDRDYRDRDYGYRGGYGYREERGRSESRENRGREYRGRR